MIVSINWINEFVNINNIDTKDILIALNNLGLEVDSDTTINIPDNVVVGYVASCEKVDGSDKLNACLVDVGDSENLEIICGANNVKSGMYVAVAKIGATLNNGMFIEKRKLKDRFSYGMICSLGELGISSSTSLSDGILSLDGLEDIEKGRNLNTYKSFNDCIIDIELTANRGDCLNVIGVAREIANYFNLDLDLNFKDISTKNPNFTLEIKDSSKDIDYIYSIVGFNDKSFSFQKELYLSFVNISYINQADAFRIFIEHSTGANCSIYNIDENEINQLSLKNIDNYDSLLINDKRISQVSIFKDEKLKNSEYYLLELSYFDPKIANQKVFDYKSSTSDDIFYKTSRGSNPDLKLSERFLHSINECEILSNTKEKITPKDDITITISHKYIEDAIGNDVKKSRCINILESLEFIVHEKNDDMILTPPNFRHDILFKQDVVEEILRVVGIDNITPKPLRILEQRGVREGYIIHHNRKRLRLNSKIAGFSEHISFLFTNKTTLQDYGMDTISENEDLLNPMNAELNTIKSSNIISLLDSVVLNSKNQFNKIALFEISAVFDKNRKQKEFLSFIYSGLKTNANIKNPKAKMIDFYDFCDMINDVIGDISIEPLDSDSSNKSIIHPYQCGAIIKNNKKIGVVYKISPSLSKKLKIQDTFFAEIDTSLLFNPHINYENISKFPIVYRDLSVLCPKDMMFFKIKKHIEELKIDNLIKFYPYDLFELEGNENSLSIRFELQSNEKTLDENDIEEIVMKNIFKSLQEKLGLELR